MRQPALIWIYIVALGASLLVSCAIISPGKFYWWDELFSYYLIEAPTFAALFDAYNDKINNTPFVYFFVGWLWGQAFGASELSLRLLSSLTFCLALLVTYALLAKRYRPVAAAFGAAAVFGLSILVLDQNAEARMYGLYMAFAALTVLLFDASRRARSCSRPLFAATLIAHALLLHTHLFGMFYSFTIIALTAFLDFLDSHWRPKLYLAYGGAWASLGLYLPTFLIQADAGVPRTWIPPPTLGDLGWFYAVDLAFTWAVPAGLFLLYLVLRRQRPANAPPNPIFVDRQSLTSRPLLLVATAFVLLPIAVWLVSLWVKPVFIGRYMIPTLLGLACVTAHYVDYLLGPRQDGAARTPRGAARGLAARAGPPVLLLGAVAFPLLYALDREDPNVGDLSAYGSDYPGLPIVVQFGNNFLRQVHYRRDSPIVHLLDWESAVDPKSGTWPPQEFKHLEALLRQFPDRFEGRIRESAGFLAETPRFLVWDYLDYDVACGPVDPWYSFRRNTNKWKESLQCPRFFEDRIRNDPRYEITLVQRIDGGGSYWGDFAMFLVERQNRE